MRVLARAIQLLMLVALLAAPACQSVDHGMGHRTLPPQVNQPQKPSETTGGGVEDGNGGNVVVCSKPYPILGNQTTYSLDLYQARQRFSSYVLHAAASPDPAEVAKAKSAIARIKTLDPHRFATYDHLISSFFDDALIDNDLHLPQLADEGVISLPGQDCSIQHTIFRREPQLPGDKWYSIQGKIWQALDSDSRAALILHEVIYREMAAGGVQSAEVPVFYNTYLLADQFKNLTPAQYVDFLKSTLNVSSFYVTDSGIVLALDGIEFDASGHVKHGKLVVGPYVDAEAKVQDNTIGPFKTASLSIAGHAFQGASDTVLEFFSDSSVASATGSLTLYPTSIFEAGACQVDIVGFPSGFSPIATYPVLALTATNTGKLASMRIAKGTALALNCNKGGETFPLLVGGTVQVSADGYLKQGISDEDQTITYQGKTYDLPAGTVLNFDSTGGYQPQ